MNEKSYPADYGYGDRWRGAWVARGGVWLAVLAVWAVAAALAGVYLYGGA